MALDRKDLFGQFDNYFADGSILVAAIRLLYGITVKKPEAFDKLLWHRNYSVCRK